MADKEKLDDYGMANLVVANGLQKAKKIFGEDFDERLVLQNLQVVNIGYIAEVLNTTNQALVCIATELRELDETLRVTAGRRSRDDEG